MNKSKISRDYHYEAFTKENKLFVYPYNNNINIFPFDGKVIKKNNSNNYFYTYNDNEIIANIINNKDGKFDLESKVIYHDNKCITSVEVINNTLIDANVREMFPGIIAVINFDDNTKKIVISYKSSYVSDYYDNNSITNDNINEIIKEIINNRKYCQESLYEIPDETNISSSREPLGQDYSKVRR